ncbi:MAG: hypothetical protein ACK56F_03585 [bacterium]
MTQSLERAAFRAQGDQRLIAQHVQHSIPVGGPGTLRAQPLDKFGPHRARRNETHAATLHSRRQP